MKKSLDAKKNSLHPIKFKMLSKEASKVALDEDVLKVTGYLAVFGIKDDDSDILLKGCFAKSLQDRGPESSTNRKIKFLYQHEMKDPIGTFTVLKEDDYGLYFEAVLDKGVPSADRTLIQLKSGTLDQFSIGYEYVWEDNKMYYDENIDGWIVKEVVLWEGSVVTFGCNEFTYFAGMKSKQRKAEMKKLQDETEAIIKAIPFKYQFDIRQIISKNIAMASLRLKDNTDDDDQDDNLDFLEQTIGHLEAGIDLVDDYDGDDDDINDDLEDMKDYHADMCTKMMAHKSRLQGEKALTPPKPGKKTKTKPLAGKDEPPATIDMNQLLSNLEIN